MSYLTILLDFFSLEKIFYILSYKRIGVFFVVKNIQLFYQLLSYSF